MRTHWEGCWSAHHECAMAEAVRLRAEVERLKSEHCRDCCCARIWARIGGQRHSGGLVDHVEELVETRDAAVAEVERLKGKGDRRND